MNLENHATVPEKNIINSTSTKAALECSPWNTLPSFPGLTSSFSRPMDLQAHIRKPSKTNKQTIQPAKQMNEWPKGSLIFVHWNNKHSFVDPVPKCWFRVCPKGLFGWNFLSTTWQNTQHPCFAVLWKHCVICLPHVTNPSLSSVAYPYSTSKYCVHTRGHSCSHCFLPLLPLTHPRSLPHSVRQDRENRDDPALQQEFKPVQRVCFVTQISKPKCAP